MLSKLVRGVRRRLSALSPSTLRFRRELERRDTTYDAAHGVDTGARQLGRLTIDSPNRQYGVEHIASVPQEFARSMAALPIAFEQFTFVDIGSGKGRALLLSLEYPFRARVGVEFAQELYDIAGTNLRGKGVELHCMEATTYDFPDAPLVVFLYNPFGPQIMANIATRLRARSAPLYVVYVNPFHTEPWLAQGFQIAVRGDPFVILTPPPAT